MHKIKLAIILLFTIQASVFCQTEAAEKANMNTKYQNNEFDAERYKFLGEKWRELINEMGGYPELPYNSETNEIEFLYIFDYPGLTKEQIFQRIQEWAAISFGKYSEVVDYLDIGTGKIIVKGWTNIVHRQDYYNFFFGKREQVVRKKCFFTYIFTLSGNKLKVQVVNISYEYQAGGYQSGSTYIPVSTMKFSIHSLYPITDDDYRSWKEHLDMLKQTDFEIRVTTKYLDTYIKDIKTDYDF